MGQVGVICKLDYLDVTQILKYHVFIRMWSCHLVTKWTSSLVKVIMSHVLSHLWCETSLLLQAVFKMWCLVISFSKNPCTRPVPYIAKNEELCGTIIYIRISLSLCIAFKKKISTCAWVKCGSHPPTFNPVPSVI